MRRLAARLCLLLLSVALLAFSAAAASINVTVRGVPVVWSGAAPYVNAQNMTLTPVRDVAEAMGLTVRWVQNQQMVELSRTYTPDNSIYQAELQSGQKEFIVSRTVSLWIGRTTYTVTNQYALYDGRTIVNTRTGQTDGTSNAAPVVRDGQTFVAIRPVAEQFGFDVLWDQSSQTVRIVNGLASDWSYAWTVTQDGSGGLLVGVHSPVNLLDATITGVTVKSTTAPGSSDGSRPIRPTTAQELAALQTTAGASLLDAVRVEYPFAAGESYTITVSLQVTKSNGASSAASGSFQINLPAPGETAGSDAAEVF